MREIEPMEIGLMFWGTQDAQTVLRTVNELGLHVGQLGVPPELDCYRTAKRIKHWPQGIPGSDHQCCLLLLGRRIHRLRNGS